MIDDPRFRTNTDRVKNIDEADRPVAEFIKARTLAENLAVFEAAEVTAAPVYDIDQFIADPHVQAREIVIDLPDAEMGSVPMHNVVPRLSGTPGEIRTPAPALGEHNDAILGAPRPRRRGARRFAPTEGHMSDATDRKLPVWRSVLYVPANVPRFIDGAHKRGADAIILDLEDSRADRRAAGGAARSGGDRRERFARRRRRARAHQPAVAADDARPRSRDRRRASTALAVTKVDSADHIRLIAEVVSELEAERGMAVGHTQFIAMIETADAWFRMPEIAKASERIVALTLGGEDFALSVGMLPTAEALFMPKQQLAIAARAAGILPLGFIGTVADYKDLDAFRETVRRSRRLGFRGASVIHPAQIPILNEEFSPAADEVASAAQDRRGLRRGGRGRPRLDLGRRQDDRRAGRPARAGSAGDS